MSWVTGEPISIRLSRGWLEDSRESVLFSSLVHWSWFERRKCRRNYPMLIYSEHWKHLWPRMVSDPCGEDWCRHSGEIFHSAVSWFERTSSDSRVHLVSAFAPSQDHLNRGSTLSITDNRLCSLIIKLSGKHELSLAFSSLLLVGLRTIKA